MSQNPPLVQSSMTKFTFNSAREATLPKSSAKRKPTEKLDKEDSKKQRNEPTIKSISNQIADMNANMNEFIKMMKKNSKRLDVVESKVEKHELDLNHIDIRVNQIEQIRINNKMEITGLLIDDKEPLKKFIIGYIRSIGIEIEDHEIVDVYSRAARGTRREDNQKRVIVVTFVHESVKNRIFIKKVNADKHTNNATIFFSHVLTPFNHHLLMKARHAVKEGKLMKAWSFNGEIFVMRSNDEGKMKITSENDLYQIINDNSIDSATPSANNAASGSRRREERERESREVENDEGEDIEEEEDDQ